MTTWRDVALELEAIVRDEDEEIEFVARLFYETGYQAGVRAGRFAELLLEPGRRREAIEEGRHAGRSEAFRQGYAYARRGGRLYRSEVA